MFQQFLERLGSIFRILPSAVTTAEALGATLAPGQKTGTAKHCAVLDAVLMGLGLAEQVVPSLGLDLDALKSGIGLIIQGVVAVRNAHHTAPPKA